MKIDINNEVIQSNERIECLILSDRKVQPFFYCSIYKGLVKSQTGRVKMIRYITCPVVNGDKPKDLVVLLS